MFQNMPTPTPRPIYTPEFDLNLPDDSMTTIAYETVQGWNSINATTNMFTIFQGLILLVIVVSGFLLIMRSLQKEND